MDKCVRTDCFNRAHVGYLKMFMVRATEPIVQWLSDENGQDRYTPDKSTKFCPEPPTGITTEKCRSSK